MRSISPPPPTPRPGVQLPPPKPARSKEPALPVDIASARAKPPDYDDAVLHLMRKYGAPIDRESYIHFAYGRTVPDWTPELEAMLPAELQDWSHFEGNQ